MDDPGRNGQKCRKLAARAVRSLRMVKRRNVWHPCDHEGGRPSNHGGSDIHVRCRQELSDHLSSLPRSRRRIAHGNLILMHTRTSSDNSGQAELAMVLGSNCRDRKTGSAREGTALACGNTRSDSIRASTKRRLGAASGNTCLDTQGKRIACWATACRRLRHALVRRVPRTLIPGTSTGSSSTSSWMQCPKAMLAAMPRSDRRPCRVHHRRERAAC
jgi:hypothetical protein